MQVVVRCQHHHYPQVIAGMYRRDVGIVCGFGVGECLFGLVINAVLLSLEERSAGLPVCLVPEDYELVVHLDG